MLPRATRRRRTPCPGRLPTKLTVIASLLALAGHGVADDTDPARGPVILLNPVVVTGTPVEADSFDLPFSISAVDLRAAQRSNLGVNASEALGSVPGLVIQNRQNYAQDLQISICGFGSRSAFGVRGVKLISDGIPATHPDGQGQAATFNLDTAERIEVLRGPFSTVFGNHAGGVIQVFSRPGEGPPTWSTRMIFGSWGTTKFGFGLEGESGGVGYVLDASRFRSDGYREHSQVRRDQSFAKITTQPDDDSTLTFVASSLRQPDTLDPQGLRWETFLRDPRAVEDPARDFNTRKRIDHLQGGLTYERDIGRDTLFARVRPGRSRGGGDRVADRLTPGCNQAAPRARLPSGFDAGLDLAPPSNTCLATTRAHPSP